MPILLHNPYLKPTQIHLLNQFLREVGAFILGAVFPRAK